MNFSRHLGDPTLWVKRDGFAGFVDMGGNRARKLEFLPGEALA